MFVSLPDGLSGTLLLPATTTSTTFASVSDEDGNRVGGFPQAFSTLVETPVTGSGTYSVDLITNPFGDTAYLSQEMKTAITTLYAMGVVNGTTDTTFSADNALSRAHLCSMLLRLLAVTDHATDNQFTDIDSSDWFYQTALDANALGLITGYSDQTYRGTTIMTRAQVYTVLSRVLTDYMGYTVDTSKTQLYTFADSGTVGSWATATAICANENLVIPQSDNTLALDTQLTRGDAAVLLYRLAQVL